jgi:hypothetical protein
MLSIDDRLRLISAISCFVVAGSLSLAIGMLVMAIR